MNIRVKVGMVEIEYNEPMDSSAYPRIISKDKYNSSTKSDRLLEVIKEIANKAAQIERDA